MHRATTTAGRPRTGGGRTALVLGAGGVVGRAYHLAALLALQRERGWSADDAALVVGTSAGSIVATLLRAGIGPEEQLAQLTGQRADLGPEVAAIAGAVPVTPSMALTPGRPTVPARQVLRRVVRGPRRTPALLSALLPRGRARLDAHAAWFDRLLGGAWPRGLAICAVRVPELRRVVWTDEQPDAPSIGTAVTASCAVPGFIAPVEHAAGRFVDGGLQTPTNLEVLLRHDIDRAIVISPMSTAGGHTLARPDRPLRWAWHRTLRDEVRRLRRAGIPTLVIQPSAAEYRRMPPNLLDGRQLPAVADHLVRQLQGRVRSGALDPRHAGGG